MKLRALLGFCVLALTPALIPGCGGSEVHAANITPGNMPDGENWDGVYFHQVYGNLHLKEQDNNLVVGKWQRTDKSAWGRLSGTKNGNVLHFQWTETKYGMVGPSAASHGRGYFQYKMPKEGKIAELDGQYGLDQEETGSEWHCVKQQHVNPDLDSIKGDVPGGGAPQGGGFE